MGEVAKIETPTEIAPVTESTSIMEVIGRAARDPDTNMEKLERLMAMYERLEASKSEAAFNDAMSEAQAKMRPVAADASNPQTRSQYASYAAIDRALRPIYTDHGFSLSFNSNNDAPPDYVNVLCYVGHKGGHTRTYQASMPADGKGAKGGDVMTKTHAMGSAFTYGQRYLLKMIFNVAVGADDDGNSAGDNGPISAEQKDDLVAMIEETGADTKRFLKVFKVAAVDEIPAEKFFEAKGMLATKKEKAAAE